MSTGLPTGGLPTSGLPSASTSAQRFLPLQRASSANQYGARATPARTVASRRSGRPNLHASALPSSNVVHLRPVDAPTSAASTSTAPTSVAPLAPETARVPLATSAAEYLADAPEAADSLSAGEKALHEAWDAPAPGLRMPSSTAAARERRRQILLMLTGFAVVTFGLAYFAGGSWIAAHIFVDIVMLGYVILLVRHRQLLADRMLKVEPIRPPVTEQAPATLQAAPSYLVRSKTGS